MMPMYCRIFLLVTRSSLPSMSWMTEESHRMDRNSSSTPLRSSSSTFFTFTLFFSVASLWDRIFSLFSLKKSKRVSLRRNYSLIISGNAFSILYSIRKFKPTSRSLSIWTRTPSFLMSSFSNCLISTCMLWISSCSCSTSSLISLTYLKSAKFWFSRRMKFVTMTSTSSSPVTSRIRWKASSKVLICTFSASISFSPPEPDQQNNEK